MSVGVVLPGLPIAVDHWRRVPTADGGPAHYFLTHMHGDHYAGLTPTWAFGRIYTSTVSARLLADKFGVDESLVTTLDVGENLVVYLDRAERHMCCVSALAANHCPGAVMFLFEGDFGRILHTGDFRHHAALLASPLLAPSRGAVDLLYLDTTYNQARCRLPSRDDAFADICRVVGAHPRARVVLGIDNLGKEELLVRLAHHFRALVVVSPARLRWLALCDVSDFAVFTDDPAAGRFVVEPRRQVTRERIRTLNEVAPTIGIVASGWATAGRAGAQAAWSAQDRQRVRRGGATDDDSMGDANDDDAADAAAAAAAAADGAPAALRSRLFRVPYSLHSSFDELLAFVRGVRPKKIHPITATFTDVAHFDSLLSREPLRLKTLAELRASAGESPAERRRASAARRQRAVARSAIASVARQSLRRALGGVALVSKHQRSMRARIEPLPPNSVTEVVPVASVGSTSAAGAVSLVTPPKSAGGAAARVELCSLPSPTAEELDDIALLQHVNAVASNSLEFLLSPPPNPVLIAEWDEDKRALDFVRRLATPKRKLPPLSLDRSVIELDNDALGAKPEPPDVAATTAAVAALDDDKATVAADDKATVVDDDKPSKPAFFSVASRSASLLPSPPQDDKENGSADLLSLAAKIDAKPEVIDVDGDDAAGGLCKPPDDDHKAGPPAADVAEPGSSLTIDAPPPPPSHQPRKKKRRALFFQID